MISLTHFFHLFVEVCLPIFVTVGLGWVLDRRFRLHLESMVKLNIYLLVPAFIFTHVVGTELGGRDALRIVAFAVCTIMAMFACSFITARALRLEPARRQALSLATMFYNCGNFGLPLVTLAFGHDGAAAQVYMLATMNVATFTVGLFLAQSHGDTPRRHWRALMSVLRQPTLYAVAAGALCRALHDQLEALASNHAPLGLLAKALWQPLDLLASGLIGFALVTLGVQMSQTRPAPFRAPLWSAMAIRLVLGPLIAVVLARMFGFPEVVAASLILAAGAPTAVNTALLAHEFGGDVSFATSAVYYSTLFSLGTTTVNLALLRYWLGH